MSIVHQLFASAMSKDSIATLPVTEVLADLSLTVCTAYAGRAAGKGSVISAATSQPPSTDLAGPTGHPVTPATKKQQGHSFFMLAT